MHEENKDKTLETVDYTKTISEIKTLNIEGKIEFIELSVETIEKNRKGSDYTTPILRHDDLSILDIHLNDVIDAIEEECSEVMSDLKSWNLKYFDETEQKPVIEFIIRYHMPILKINALEITNNIFDKRIVLKYHLMENEEMPDESNSTKIITNPYLSLEELSSGKVHYTTGSEKWDNIYDNIVQSCIIPWERLKDGTPSIRNLRDHANEVNKYFNAHFFNNIKYKDNNEITNLARELKKLILEDIFVKKHRIDDNNVEDLKYSVNSKDKTELTFLIIKTISYIERQVYEQIVPLREEMYNIVENQ